MKILCLRDADRASTLSRDLLERFERAVRSRGHSLEVVDLAKGDLAFCFGCLRCWSSGSGVCVSRDRMVEIEEKLQDCDFILFLTPVLFGSFSSTMKTPIEKGLGNKLGGGKLYPQLIIGYGEDVSEEEMRCFVDITLKHRGPADIVHPELSAVSVEALVTRSVEDNTAVMHKIEQAYLEGGGT